MSELNLDKEVLWICPHCQEPNLVASRCLECKYDGLYLEVINEVKATIKSNLWEKLGPALGFGLFFMLCLGVPVGLGTASYLQHRNDPPPAPPSLLSEEALNREEADAQAKRNKEAEITAYQEYVKTHYTKWSLKGTDERSSYPFTDLYLVQDQKSKIIKVQYKRFKDLDGATYFAVSRVSAVDLVGKALDEAEEEGAENEREREKDPDE